MNLQRKFVAISALALLPLAGISAHAQSTPPAPPTAPKAPAAPRAEAHAFSVFAIPGSYLGVQTENVTRDNFSKYNLSEPVGVAVVKVSENSPAAQAGLREGDVIISFEGDEVKSTMKLQRLISEVAPDQKAQLKILRGGAEQEITVTMGKRPAAQIRTFNGAPGEGFFPMPPMDAMPRIEQLPRMENMPRLENLPRDFKFEMPDLPNGNNVLVMPGMGARRLGISVLQLSKQLGDYFGAGEGKGLLVQDVSEGSAAAKAGLRAGDVIVEIEGEPVSRQFDLIRALNKKTEGDISLTIIRDRSRQTVRVALESVKPATQVGENRFKI